ncbi:hypothetical protein NP493_839g01090 [Ridgeia piscesae]|uniref:Exocyst complex component n=1 Tax=Ridgeia piscesae TaxID=27915 RepID=A0AAD9NNU1_RIDPI|nr:hypothetical protein NP493_839g01090 [Ridgeia piscesae]
MASGEEEGLAEGGGRLSNPAKDSDFIPQDQHELLITEIESSDGHLGTTLRNVYDGDDPDVFLERLDLRIKAHDKEIERMCNYHYQGFIESIRSLLQVRTDADNLKVEIKTTNEQLQKSGLSLMAKGQELVTYRKIERNIDSAIETLNLCLPVLETYGKLREQMKNKRYYPALKTLEQLEHTYLPRVSNYRFSKVMCDTIPHLRDNIKEASMSDLKDFLENIRKHSDRIGETAMKHAAEQAHMDPSLAMKKGKKRKAPRPPNPFTGKVEADEEEDKGKNPFNDEEPDPSEGLSAQDLVDFSPVYRCLHIYSVLGVRDTFESYYRKQRRKQARLALQPPQNMERARRLAQAQSSDTSPQETLEGYKTYFHEVIGFFVVEDHILNTTSGLVNRAYIDELWDMALSKAVAVLRTHIGFCTDPSLMLQIKNLLMLFCHTLRGYGFTVSQLYDLLLEIRDQYSEILMQKWVGVFNKIFDEDNYTPIMVETDDEYEVIISKFPFRDEQLEQECPPKWLPFSQFVPKVYRQVKEYIYACLKFSDDLHLSFTEKEAMICRCFNSLLCETLRDTLSALMVRPHIGLLELIQIAINMNYLEQSCTDLEEFISNVIGADQENVHMCKLQGTAMFKDARSEAEEQIYKQINKKIDEFFELAEYDWQISEATGVASDYISDMITFLQSTFESFTNLPEKVAQTACMSACKHISHGMQTFLTNNEVRCISMPALHQFNLDLVQCEQFASSEPVPGLNDGTLQLAFVDLRQLLDLFISWDWTNYIADFGKPYNKYLRVSPNTCIVLLEK